LSSREPTTSLGSGGQGGGRPCGTAGRAARAAWRVGAQRTRSFVGARDRGARAAWRRLALGTHAMAAWRRRRTATGRGAGEQQRLRQTGPR